VALAARKPLLSIGVADVTTDPTEVERNFTKYFDLATKWQAILLM
jgi:hypothetical protein